MAEGVSAPLSATLRGVGSAGGGAPAGPVEGRLAAAPLPSTEGAAGDEARERRRVRVTGVVQGVGFRPFVWRLAGALALDGWVRNDAAGVEVEVEGGCDRLEAFCHRLRAEAPPLARVERVEWTRLPPVAAERGFRIVESGGGAAVTTAVSPDVAVCDECLAELLDPADRRYRYPFINCTQCGPRFTITRHLPYDRPQTSMAPFALCSACRREYTSPADRRFHAEPNACPACGPRLALWDPAGAPLAVEDPIAEVVARLRAGQVVALKGLGGFHLACDARRPEAVALLRGRKLREAKPLALLVAHERALEGLCELDEAERALLRSPERPIVLLRKRPGADDELAGVAPGMAWLGAMLPSTPLQHLLFHEAAGRPRLASPGGGDPWSRGGEVPRWALVMTSANPGGEPLVIGNREAVERLGGIADALLVHDREILLRCDDSVARVEPLPGAAAATTFVRRARGYSPRAIRLPLGGPSVLAVGAALKNTVCLTRGDQAFLSPHVGDLDNAATCVALEEAAAHLERILERAPALVAHDLHPDFFSTRFAQALAAERGLPVVAVQHHHAHIAAIRAEHGVTGPVLGLALDGVGLGDDGGVWGGELLRVEAGRSRRLGHLRPLPLPGGDRAAREPWRMAAAALFLLGRGAEIGPRFSEQRAARGLGQVLERGVNCPPTSSAGRLFDAAAALLGLRPVALFEGQAAMELEGLAVAHGPEAPLPDGVRIGGAGFAGVLRVLDPLPLLAQLSREPDAARGAARFHATLAAALVEWAAAAAVAEGLDTVALGGGCFLNRLLSRQVADGLVARGLRVLPARAAPPNDGGLALGQALVALERYAEGTLATAKTPGPAEASSA